MTRRPGWSLVELTVVVAIIALLAGLTLAAVQKVRAAALRAECLNRHRQTALAVHNFESAHGHLPPASLHGPLPEWHVPEGVRHGFWVHLLPHLDQSPVANQYQFTRSYDDPANQQAARSPVAVLTCPAAPPGRTQEWPGGWGAVADAGPVEVNPFLADIGLIDPAASFTPALPANKPGRWAEITDGLTHTLLIAEPGDRPPEAWASPTATVGVRQLVGELHRGGITASFADGSSRWIPDSTGLRQMARMATRAGGD